MMPSGTYSPIPGSSSTENIREHRPEDDPAVQQYLSVSGEGLHQAICALYAAKHKNMTIDYLLQALRAHDVRTTDDMLVAVARFNASFCGCNG